MLLVRWLSSGYARIYCFPAGDGTTAKILSKLRGCGVKNSPLQHSQRLDIELTGDGEVKVTDVKKSGEMAPYRPLLDFVLVTSYDRFQQRTGTTPVYQVLKVINRKALQELGVVFERSERTARRKTPRRKLKR